MCPAFECIRYGESAFYVDLGLEHAPERAARTHAAAAALRARLGGAADVVVGAGTILVAGAAAGDEGAIRGALAEAASGPGAGPAGRTHAVRVVYDGPDLDEVAAATGASPAEVVAWHAGREVVAELLGFLPGFAYLGDVDPRIVRPRRPSPRPIVPAGSVGIAGCFTGIYPFASPGGWSLIGRAVDAALFDPERDPPALFAPGDRVRFVPVDAAGAAPPAGGRPPAGARWAEAAPAARALEIVAAPAGATVQDRGRLGQLAKGLPPSGPLDVETHGDANAAAGNARGAAAIEIPGGGLEARARGDLVVSVDGAPAVALRDGEPLRVAAAARAVRYLAVRGGIDVPARLGARATLIAARLGGLDGRPLRRGDHVPVGGGADALGGGADRLGGGAATGGAGGLGHAALALDPGPHVARFPAGALDVLLATAWRISRWGDRVGVRLEGGRVPREGPDLALPAPMLRGAIQVATDGTPIVLGPDHPVTGGYPVLAVLRRAELPRLARLRPGDMVRFRLENG